jgi:hypothetical protein
MSWHYSQALEVAYLEANSLAGEPSAPSNSMPSAPDDSCSDKMKGTHHRSLYGTMFAPSTDATGAALLMWFRAASRVRTSAAPVKVFGWFSLPCFVHCVFWTVSVMAFSGWGWHERLFGIGGVIFLILFVTHYFQDRSQLVVWWMRLDWKDQSRFSEPPMAPWSIIIVDNVWHIVVLWAVWKFVV